jgi:acetyl/propionyl-CoA carboxylase alpha subunit
MIAKLIVYGTTRERLRSDAPAARAGRVRDRRRTTMLHQALLDEPDFSPIAQSSGWKSWRALDAIDPRIRIEQGSSLSRTYREAVALIPRYAVSTSLDGYSGRSRRRVYEGDHLP